MFLCAALASVERMGDKRDLLAPSGHTTTGQAFHLLTDGALAGDWLLDPCTSSVELETRSMWGLVPVKGVFHEISGKGTISADGAISGFLTVTAASVDTNNAWRDKHLRSPDFLDSRNRPNITFAVEAVRPFASHLVITGALTVRDCTKRVSFDATVRLDGSDAIRVDTTVHINRSDFGLTWNWLGMASSDNTISVHAVFIRR